MWLPISLIQLHTLHWQDLACSFKLIPLQRSESQKNTYWKAILIKHSLFSITTGTWGPINTGSDPEHFQSLSKSKFWASSALQQNLEFSKWLYHLKYLIHHNPSPGSKILAITLNFNSLGNMFLSLAMVSAEIQTLFRSWTSHLNVGSSTLPFSSQNWFVVHLLELNKVPYKIFHFACPLTST